MKYLIWLLLLGSAAAQINNGGGAGGGVSTVAGTASQIDSTGTTAITLSLDQAFTAQEYGVDNSGSSTAYTVPLPLAWTSNADGKRACFIAGSINTTTTPTVAFNSQTALSIVRFNGGTLAVGDVGNVMPVCGIVKSTSFELLNPQKTSGSGGFALVNSPTFTGGINIPTLTTTTNCAAVGSAASPSVAACTAAPAGSFSCATNAVSTCTVSTTAVTANSEIFIIQRADAVTGTRLGVTCNATISAINPAPTTVVAGTSFSFGLTQPITNPDCYSYFIVN